MIQISCLSVVGDAVSAWKTRRMAKKDQNVLLQLTLMTLWMIIFKHGKNTYMKHFKIASVMYILF
jgi:hypothetical protein